MKGPLDNPPFIPSGGGGVDNWPLVQNAGEENSKNSFVFTIETTGVSETFTLPLEAGGTYNFIIGHGDGEFSLITAFDDAAVTHTYANAGIHQIVIEGEINGWRFNNGGDCAKMRDIKSWGCLNTGNNSGSFYGCSGLTVSATDKMDVSGETSLRRKFRGCSSLTSLDTSLWDLSNITDMSESFYECSSLSTLDASSWDMGNVTTFAVTFYNCFSLATLDVSSWDVSSNTIFSSCFRGATSLITLDVSSWNTSNLITIGGMFLGSSSITDPAINNWDITSITGADSFLSGAKPLSTAVYDATLIAWATQAEQPNVTIHFGTSKYTAGGAAAAARAALVANGWIITDGGMA